MKSITAFLFCLFLSSVCSSQSYAATYYVDFQNGSDTNNGQSTSMPFKHCPGDIKATGTASSTIFSPGDSIFFKGGVAYDGRIDANWSGNSSHVITYNGNTAGGFGTGPALVKAFTVENVNYITIQGFEITHAASAGMSLEVPSNTSTYASIFMQNSNYINILNNNINNTQDYCIRSYNFDPAQTTNNSVIQGNTISHCGNQIAGGVGWEAAMGILVFGNNNLVQNNIITHIGETCIEIYGGNYNVVRENTCHDNSILDADPGYPAFPRHPDFIAVFSGVTTKVSNPGNGYKVGDILNVLEPPISNSPNPISSVLIDSGGSGYSVGDILNIIQNGASGGSATVVDVNAGVITELSLTTPGTGYSTGTGLLTSGGHGTNATVNISNGVTATVSSVNCSPAPCTGPVTGIENVTGGAGYINGTLATSALTGSGSGATINYEAALPVEHNLIENNSAYNMPSANQKFALLQDQGFPSFGSTDVVLRYNSASNMGSPFLINNQQFANTVVYNNSVDVVNVSSGKAWNDVDCYSYYNYEGAAGAPGCQIFNNIYYNTVYNEAGSGGNEDSADSLSQTGFFADYNLAYNSGVGDCSLTEPANCWNINCPASPGIGCPVSGQEIHSQPLLNQNPQFNNAPLFGFAISAIAPTVNGVPGNQVINTTNPTASISSNEYTFQVNDYIEYNADGIVRQVTAVSPSGTPQGSTYIVVTPALSANSAIGDTILDWGSSKNFTYDLSLQTGSHAIGAGGPLTTVASVKSATSIVVDNANFFQDGWAGVQADWIAVGTTTNAAQISSIDYSTNTITLASPISAAAGNPVWLYKNSNGQQVLYGNAPDLGSENQNLTIVTSGTGSGTISNSLPGVSCGNNCNGYIKETTLTLTATPSSGSTFTGWSGGGCSGTGTCIVTMSSSQTVTANFTSSSNTLYGDVIDSGHVTIYDAELTAQYAIGLSVPGFDRAHARVDGNTTVDIYDAYLIAEYAVGIITKFAAVQP